MSDDATDQADDSDDLAQFASELAAQGSPITYGPPPEEAPQRESPKDEGTGDYMTFLHDLVMQLRYRIDELERRSATTESAGSSDSTGLCPSDPPAAVIGDSGEGSESPATDTFGANSVNDGWVDVWVVMDTVYDADATLYQKKRLVRMRVCAISAEVRSTVFTTEECVPP